MTEVAVQVPQGVQRKATLLDLLDRVLGKGVVAYGDIVLSIADLDLVYLNLRAVLSAIGTLEQGSGRGVPPSAPPPFSGGAPEPWEAGPSHGDGADGKLVEGRTVRGSTGSPRTAEAPRTAESPRTAEAPRTESDAVRPEPRRRKLVEGRTSKEAGRLALDPRKLEQGLAKLVLTLINLLRRLMERQAIRRMEAGTLTPEQLERAGGAFQRLDERLKELTEQFGLKEEDLNLDLGPLGKLV